MSKFQPELFGDDDAFQRPSMSAKENAETYVSILALNSIRGVGQKTIQAIYDLGVINGIWHQSKIEVGHKLADVAEKHPDLPQLIAQQGPELLERGQRTVERLHRNGISFLANRYLDFPGSLNAINDPPRWLFVLGNTGVLSAPNIVAIVGAREASQEGTTIAYHLAKAFVSKNVIILSGLAKGIDHQAHQAAVDYYGQTIGVLGHGFEALYATKDRHLWDEIVTRDGAIVSEYLPNEAPSRQNFLRRNELQVALSSLVMPIEVPELSSGTGATIRRALSQKKPLLGVYRDNRENSATTKTIDNLRGLSIPVFSLPSQSDEFWKSAMAAMPDHDWDTNPRPRQKRFVKALFTRLLIVDDFAEELERASFTENDIDWLAAELKKRVGKNDPSGNL